MRTTEQGIPRVAAVVLLIVAFAFVGFMTLRPSPSVVESPVICIFCGSLGGVDFILNVVLFVPIGMTLRWTMGRWSSVVITGIVTTLVIETLQWRIIAGRDAALGDIVANTIGTLIGSWLAVAIFSWAKAGVPAARTYARVSGLAASLVLIASVILLQPLVPRYPLWVQWMPLRTMTDPFEGHLVGVEVKGRNVHGAESFRSREAFDTIARHIDVRAHFETPAPAPTRRPAIIVRTANPLEEGFFLAQNGDAATFRSHMVAERFRLRPLLVGLDGAFSAVKLAEGSKSFVIEGESDPRSIRIRRRAAVDLDVTVRRTVGLAWAMLLPWDVALSPRWSFANAAWLAVLVFPTSFFVARVAKTSDQSGRWVAWWPLALVLAVLIAAPLTGLSALGTAEWFGTLAGIAGGWLLEQWCARLAGRGAQPQIVAA